MKIKILIYGEGYWYGLGVPLKKAFESIGHDVNLFDWTKYLFRAKKANIVNRIFDRFLFAKVADKINNNFQEYIKHNRYDLLLVLQGKHLYSETLQFAKENCTNIANWNIDDFYNPNVRTIDLDSFKYYDWIFSPRKHLFDEYTKRGAQRIECINWFYYPERQYPINVEAREADKLGSDIAFIGTWSKYRENILFKLEGLKLKVWGSSWHKAKKEFKNKFKLMYQEAWFEEMSKVINSTKMIVDVLTIENRDTTNLKNFQVPACGGFLLTQRTNEILELFEEGKEVVCYSSTEELKSKCKHYLLHDADREKIASNAYKKVINGRNTLLDRAMQISNIIKDHL